MSAALFVFSLSVISGFGQTTWHASVKDRAKNEYGLQTRGSGAKRWVDLHEPLANILFAFNPVRTAVAGQSNGKRSLSSSGGLYARSSAIRPAMKQEGPDEEATPLEKFLGNIFVAFEKAGKAAADTTDKWSNTEFEVDKDAGDVIPKIRGEGEKNEPNPALSDGALVSSSAEAVQLQSEFQSLLLQRSEEATTYSITKEGGILFASVEDLAALVSKYTYRKLLDLAREPGRLRQAMSSYIDDLESDLGSANVALTELRREVNETASQLSESSATSDSMQAQLAELQSILDEAQKELEAKSATQDEFVIAKEQMVAAEGDLSEAKSEVERLRTEMKSVERASAAQSEEQIADAKEIAKLRTALKQQEEATQEAKQEAAKVQALLQEQEAASKEVEAELDLLLEEKERSSKREAEAAAMREAALRIQEEQAAVQQEFSKAKAALQQLREKDRKDTDDEMLKEDEATHTEEGDADANENEDTNAHAFAEEAVAGTQEDVDENTQAAVADSQVKSTRRPALSKMRKPELIAECEERGLDASGKVADLRKRLKAARAR